MPRAARLRAATAATATVTAATPLAGNIGVQVAVNDGDVENDGDGDLGVIQDNELSGRAGRQHRDRRRRHGHRR